MTGQRLTALGVIGAGMWLVIWFAVRHLLILIF